MIEGILDSKVKIKIARFFAGNRSGFQVSDIARMLKISKSRASECLRELAEKGVVERRTVGRSSVYKPASSSLAKSVFRAVSGESALIGKIEREVASETKKFRPASVILFGSAEQGMKPGSDIDFLLLRNGRIEKDKIYRIVARLTEKFGVHVSIMAMDVKDFANKARQGNEFALNVMSSGRVIYGSDPEKLVWRGK